ncbi:hypothetical protein MHLP_02505 [Candidatus Mycoplasma haematolamae str. Purdue]|uniref:Uncharacterized protein n=1 Tax=Mycoplasma haematolamae (strain Purdue) TaxID=1212765 RepID=I7CFT4_MYCHA|nr:hypothetical protein [Candidatus Mycoplasma haematolamae]AFO52081.1 hypothetical protein MHLP_02505 [Candidatus Mycoplasma haematolamae str. Purdue]
MIWKEVALVVGGIGGVSAVSGGVGTTIAQVLDRDWRSNNVVTRVSTPSKDSVEAKEVTGKTYSFTFQSNQEPTRLICPEGSHPDLVEGSGKVWVVCKQGNYKASLTFKGQGPNPPKEVTCTSSGTSNDSFKCQGKEPNLALTGSKHEGKYKGESPTKWAVWVR